MHRLSVAYICLFSSFVCTVKFLREVTCINCSRPLPEPVFLHSLVIRLSVTGSLMSSKHGGWRPQRQAMVLQAMHGITFYVQSFENIDQLSFYYNYSKYVFFCQINTLGTDMKPDHCSHGNGTGSSTENGPLPCDHCSNVDFFIFCKIIYVSSNIRLYS